MANISVTYSFTNGTTADASEVNTNFQNIINGLSDGSKDISVAAITAAGIFTANGAVNLGNATSDDLTITARIASDIDPKTAATNTLGDSTQTWLALYLDGSATDGGAIYFDAGTSEYIKMNAAGTSLAFGINAVESVIFGSASGEYVFNETGADINFRVEGDTNTSLLFVDAGLDRIGFNVAAPAYKFDFGGVSASDPIARFSTALGTTDGNYASVSIYDSTSAGFISELGMRYESTATAGPAGYVRLNSRAAQQYYLWVATNSNLEISATFANVGGTGTGTVVGSQTSDERLKSNIKDLDLGLETILKLQPIRYEMYGNEEIGFGAQRTQEFIPEAVFTTREPLYTNGEEGVEETNDRMGMHYVRIIPVLVNAIKELESRLKQLEQ